MEKVEVTSLHINIREMLVVYFATRSFREMFHGKHIKVYSDNITTVQVINKITLYNVCSVHRGAFSTWGHTMSTLGDIMNTSGDTMSTSGDIMSTSGGYHEYIRGCSVHQGFQ